VYADPAALAEQIATWSAAGTPFYAVPDCEDNADLDLIVERFGHLGLLTGGSGILEPLGRRVAGTGRRIVAQTPPVQGRSIILVGSCSQASFSQIGGYRSGGGTVIRLDARKLASGENTAASVWADAPKQGDLLFCSATTREEMIPADELPGVDGLIENTLAEIAALAQLDGVRKIIAAGGETSGAVTRALGHDAFRIGPIAAPGVPVLVPLTAPDSRLVLKSGNFGATSFFADTIALLS
ncbi:nucleotide-binding domain containing protein, partial [Actinomyces sp. MRS3W]|uniref:nucleotide-binding domain containing protein n=1 Tax=Actinomyces sp. MRS3W TaxID=2800796 RepID=UPI0028FD05EA